MAQSDLTVGDQITHTEYPLLCLLSPNGTKYVITVEDDGTLVTTEAI